MVVVTDRIQNAVWPTSIMVGNRPYDREAFNRSTEHSLENAGERPVRLLSPEDTILRKLEWFRQGGEVSNQQWRDVIGVLVARRGLLDEKYLESWAAELKLSALLSRAREEVKTV